MELKYCERCGSIVKSETFEANDDPREQVICDACLDGGPESSAAGSRRSNVGFANAGADSGEEGSGSPSSLPSADSMEYFSSQTIAVKKKKHFGDSVESKADRSSLTLKNSGEEVHLDASRELPLGLGSATPARSADRIQFNCLHCHSKLLVKPVKKLSQMACPRCAKKMYIDPNGQVAKVPARPEEIETVSFHTGQRTVVPSIDGDPEPGETVRVKRPVAPGIASQAPRVGSFRLRAAAGEPAPAAQQAQAAPSAQPAQPAEPSGSSSAVKRLGGSKGLSNLVLETQVRQSDSARIRAGGSQRPPESKEKSPSFRIPSGSASGSFQVRAGAGAKVAEEEGFSPVIMQRDGGPVPEPERKPHKAEAPAPRKLPQSSAKAHGPEMVKASSSRGSPYLLAVIFGLLLITPLALLGVLLPPAGTGTAARPGTPAAAEESWPLVRSLGETVQQGVLRILEGVGIRKP